MLEIGVGTGRNLAHYPATSRAVALDLSPEMLKRAARKATRAGRSVDLLLADAQHLPFKDGVFDTVLATLVFCSVPDPVRGLSEAGRAVRPDGQILLLEHVRAENGLLGKMMDALNRLTAPGGENVNRDTAASVRRGRTGDTARGEIPNGHREAAAGPTGRPGGSYRERRGRCGGIMRDSAGLPSSAACSG